MSRNPYGNTITIAQEWGRKARKAEARDRGLSAAADRSAIAEGLDDHFDTIDHEGATQ